MVIFTLARALNNFSFKKDGFLSRRIIHRYCSLENSFYNGTTCTPCFFVIYRTTRCKRISTTRSSYVLWKIAKSCCMKKFRWVDGSIKRYVTIVIRCVQRLFDDVQLTLNNVQSLMATTCSLLRYRKSSKIIENHRKSYWSLDENFRSDRPFTLYSMWILNLRALQIEANGINEFIYLTIIRINL